MATFKTNVMTALDNHQRVRTGNLRGTLKATSVQFKNADASGWTKTQYDTLMLCPIGMNSIIDTIAYGSDLACSNANTVLSLKWFVKKDNGEYEAFATSKINGGHGMTIAKGVLELYDLEPKFIDKTAAEILYANNKSLYDKHFRKPEVYLGLYVETAGGAYTADGSVTIPTTYVTIYHIDGCPSGDGIGATVDKAYTASIVK